MGSFDFKVLERSELNTLTEKLRIFAGAITDEKEFFLAIDQLMMGRLARFPDLGVRFAACPLLLGLGVLEEFDETLRQHVLEWLLAPRSNAIVATQSQYSTEYGDLAVSSRLWQPR
ncbi:hypothetical protein GKO28_14900 [Deefgea sp. CFH1-16]|nr:hypothetical protein [Deefgea sp. CFH1-16]